MIPYPQTSGKFEPLRTPAFDCLVAPEWRACIEALLAASTDRTDAADWTPAAAIPWREVKRSTVRTIYAGAIPGPGAEPVAVHLKLFRATRLSDRARDAFAGSRSARECRNLLRARDRGLPSVEPLAAGRFGGSWGSRSFLITRTEAGIPLPRGALDPADAAACGRLLRRAHDAGLHARDLHAGNVLRRPDGTLVLLDLTSAAFGDPLHTDERAHALAFFCADLDGLVRDPAARPLADAYGAGRRLLDLAERAGRRLRNRAVTAFGRRAFRPCRSTRVERPRRRPRVFLHEPAAALWDEARTALAGLDDAPPAKTGRRGSVYLFDAIVVKERSAAAARRLFQSAYWLAFAGVPTPLPVAATTFRSRGAVATVRHGNVDVEHDLAQGLATDHAELLACATSFGAAVGRLHSFGLRNRDMKFSNLLRDPADHTILMADLDGVRRQVPGDNRGRAGDLGRLLAAFRHAGSPGGVDVVRAFLRSYLRTCWRLRLPIPHRRHVLAQAGVAARAWAVSHGTD